MSSLNETVARHAVRRRCLVWVINAKELAQPKIRSVAEAESGRSADPGLVG
jgi:hypothetical protein